MTIYTGKHAIQNKSLEQLQNDLRLINQRQQEKVNHLNDPEVLAVYKGLSMEAMTLTRWIQHHKDFKGVELP